MQRLKQVRLYVVVGIIQGVIGAVLLIWLKPTRREKRVGWLYLVGLLTGGLVMWHDARTNGIITGYVDQATETVATGLETAAAKIRNPAGRKPSPPDAVTDNCKKLAELIAYRDKHKCTWQEAYNEQDVTDKWRRTWQKKCAESSALNSQ